LADYERLITLAPNDADLYVGRGQVHLFRKKTLPAYNDFTKAIELDPQSSPAYAGRGATQIERKRYEEAIADLDQAITLDPKLADAYYRRAETYFHMNNMERAEADIAKALELSPNFAEVYRLKGMIADGQQNKDAATEAYRKALELDPFIEGAADALKKLTVTEERPLQPIAAPVSGWEIVSPANKRFIATNPTFPKAKVLLEMHGEGPPEILEWTVLGDFLKGFGLLRYTAGMMPDAGADLKARYEYVAIIDLKRQIVVSIEPYLAGATQAKWEWSKSGVVVTDAEGVISAHELREPPPAPRPEQPQAQQQQRPWYDQYGGGERRRPRGLFEWLFN
jgi:tetratricopeptide (TPR) repeat protein